MPKRKPEPFKPYVANNPASVAGGKFARVYVLAPSFMGVRVVERLCHMEGLQLGVRERYIPAAQLPHYTPLPDEKYSLQSMLDELKTEMLTHGATPEAVMLVGAVSPFTEEELNTMAEKLKTKGTAKKAATKGSGKAATAKKDAGAVGAAQDFTYKHAVKPAEAVGSTREGTWTRRMTEIIMGNKNSADARAELEKDKEHGDRRLDFGWAEKKGFITR